MKTYSFRGRDISIPESLDELTPDQYIYYIYLASWLTAGEIDLDFWRVRWFSFLAGMGSANYTILRPEFIARAEEMLHPVTDPFLYDSPRGPWPSFKTCRNLLPIYRGFKGPADLLAGVKFSEFVKCAVLLEQHQSATDADDLDAYSEIARALYHIPEGTAVPDILLWHAPVLFGSVWAEIRSNPININGRMIDFSIIFKSSGPRRPDDKTGWTGIAFEVAAAGIFGNINELDDADFWAVLIYLYKCKFEYLNDKTNK